MQNPKIAEHGPAPILFKLGYQDHLRERFTHANFFSWEVSTFRVTVSWIFPCYWGLFGKPVTRKMVELAAEKSTVKVPIFLVQCILLHYLSPWENDLTKNILFFFWIIVFVCLLIWHSHLQLPVHGNVVKFEGLYLMIADIRWKVMPRIIIVLS